MAEMDMSYGKVEAFFSNLLDSKTPRARKYYVYGTYLQAIEAQKQRKVFEDAYPQRPAENYFAHIVSDDMAVMEHLSKRGVFYTPCLMVNNEPKVFNILYESFDKALIAGLCFKYVNTDEPLTWISKMLSMPSNIFGKE